MQYNFRGSIGITVLQRISKQVGAMSIPTETSKRFRRQRRWYSSFGQITFTVRQCETTEFGHQSHTIET